MPLVVTTGHSCWYSVPHWYHYWPELLILSSSLMTLLTRAAHTQLLIIATTDQSWSYSAPHWCHYWAVLLILSSTLMPLLTSYCCVDGVEFPVWSASPGLHVSARSVMNCASSATQSKSTSAHPPVLTPACTFPCSFSYSWQESCSHCPLCGQHGTFWFRYCFY